MNRRIIHTASGAICGILMCLFADAAIDAFHRGRDHDARWLELAAIENGAAVGLLLVLTRRNRRPPPPGSGPSLSF